MDCAAKIVVQPIQSVRLTTIPVAIRDSTTEYDGEYEFTPSDVLQTIMIAGKKATENIVINPIPQNYGLITWDGSTLTVS